MGQADIIKALEKKKGQYLDIHQLMIATKTTRSNTSRACRDLVKHGEIKKKEIKEGPFTKYLFSL